MSKSSFGAGSVQEILRRCAADNPWWRAGGGIDEREASQPPRPYLAAFLPLAQCLEERRIALVVGPSQVGKSWLLRHLVQRLLHEGIAGVRICYLGLSAPLYADRSLDDLVRLYLDSQGHSADSPTFVLLDDIHYRCDWQRQLQGLPEAFPATRFVACTSATPGLPTQSGEPDSPWHHRFILPPLTFQEFLRFSGTEEALIVERDGGRGTPHFEARDIHALNREFVRYLNFGGFPSTVMDSVAGADAAHALRIEVAKRVLSSDLPSLSGMTDSRELNRLFTALARHTGEEIGLEALASRLSIPKPRLIQYLDYLESAMLVRRVHRIDAEARPLQRARGFRCYLVTPCLWAALFGDITAEDAVFPRLASNAIWSQWLHDEPALTALRYAGWKAGRQALGVDLVSLDATAEKPRFAVEVVWNDDIVATTPRLRGLKELGRRHRLGRPPVVATRTLTSTIDLDGLEVELTPAALLCYTIGAKLLRAAARDRPTSNPPHSDAGLAQAVPVS